MYMNRFKSFFSKLFGAGTEQQQVSREGNFFTRLFNRKERAERRAAKQREKERKKRIKRIILGAKAQGSRSQSSPGRVRDPGKSVRFCEDGS